MIHNENVDSTELLLQNPIVKEHIDKNVPTVFYVPLTEIPDSIKNTLSSWLKKTPDDLPFRIFKGDTDEHVDFGDGDFEHTCILYVLVSSEEGVGVGGGELVIENNIYPIKQGEFFVFKEGTPHKTQNMGNSVRLAIGPFNENGLPVGAPGIQYYTDSTLQTSVEFQIYSGDTIYILDQTILPSIPANSVFVGWYVANDGTTYHSGEIIQPGSPYASGDYYNVYPVFSPRLSVMHFTNNAQVYYKPGSLSLGSANTVRNWRSKSKRT